MKSHNIIVIAPIVLGLGGQAVEALGFQTYGHEFDSRIRSSFFLCFLFYFYFFVSRIHDSGPQRVKTTVTLKSSPIMVDETTDVSNWEQATIVVHWATEQYQVHRVLNFITSFFQ